MMNLEILPSNMDIKYFLSQSQAETEKIVAGMVSLMNINAEKLASMQNQKWFQRMWFTVSGMNKATVKEMKQNQDKLLAYSVQIITKLIDEKCISDAIISNLAVRLNEIYFSHIQLKGTVYELIKELNGKIESVDNYHNLITDIQNDKYDHSKPLVGLLEILCQLDERTLTDKKSLVRIKETMQKNGFQFSQEISIPDFAEQVFSLPDDSVGQVYLFAQNYRELKFIDFTCCLIELYHFELKSNRAIIKEEAVQTALRNCSIKSSVKCNIDDLYYDIENIAVKKIEALRSLPALNDSHGKNDSEYNPAQNKCYKKVSRTYKRGGNRNDEIIISILQKYLSGGWLYKLHCGYMGSNLCHNAFNNIVLKAEDFILDSEKEILGIVDTSALENGKEGAVFTRKAVYLTDTLAKPIQIYYNTIKRATYKKGLLGKTLIIERERWHGGNIEWFSTNAPKDKMADALSDIAHLYQGSY